MPHICQHASNDNDANRSCKGSNPHALYIEPDARYCVFQCKVKGVGFRDLHHRFFSSVRCTSLCLEAPLRPILSWEYLPSDGLVQYLYWGMVAPC